MYLVYILRSNNLSYIGMTNDFLRRWQQHNNILKGGAKYTISKNSYWEPNCIIDVFKSKSEAMQCEWSIKHNKKSRGDIGRVKYLNNLLNIKFAGK